jgi:dGTPase
MGHDLGHTPFGHNGEDFLSERHAGGFRHNEQSLRVVDVLENSETRQGMNLTEEVRDGILNHTGKHLPFTLEGQIVRISDRIAYINHDIDDALRSGVIRQGDLPEDCVDALGKTTTERINMLITDLVENSDGENFIMQGDACAFFMNKLRDFMFVNVYHNSVVKGNEKLDRVRDLIFSLYDYFLEHSSELPAEFARLVGDYGLAEMVKDHIASMTERYAVNCYNRIFTAAHFAF